MDGKEIDMAIYGGNGLNDVSAMSYIKGMKYMCFDVSVVQNQPKPHRAYSLLMMPSLVLSRNFTIAVISLPAGTCSLI